VSARTVEVGSVSQGWVGACSALLACGGVANHLVVRMSDPLPEDARIRQAADAFAEGAGVQEIDEVRNTIFPAGLAEDFTDPDELVAEYLEDYPVLKALGSDQGTYFGRICEYPHPDKTTTPQLQNTIKKLKESRDGTRWRAIYQINMYAEHKDWKKKRGNFPCMAHLGFQLGGPGARPERLDCVALYRFQDMVLKGYGNFLGLAQLQEYVATATHFLPGELTVIAGHADLELNATTRRHLKQLVAENTG
jgi:thymidylate synthase